MSIEHLSLLLICLHFLPLHVLNVLPDLFAVMCNRHIVQACAHVINRQYTSTGPCRSPELVRLSVNISALIYRKYVCVIVYGCEFSSW